MQKKKIEKSVILKAVMPASVFGEIIAEYADRMQIMEISNTEHVPWHKNKPRKQRKSPGRKPSHARGAFTNAIMAALKANKKLSTMELRTILEKGGFETKQVYGTLRRLERQKAVKLNGSDIALASIH